MARLKGLRLLKAATVSSLQEWQGQEEVPQQSRSETGTQRNARHFAAHLREHSLRHRLFPPAKLNSRRLVSTREAGHRGVAACRQAMSGLCCHCNTTATKTCLPCSAMRGLLIGLCSWGLRVDWLPVALAPRISFFFCRSAVPTWYWQYELRGAMSAYWTTTLDSRSKALLLQPAASIVDCCAMHLPEACVDGHSAGGTVPPHALAHAVVQALA